jgi:hypothetical protein
MSNILANKRSNNNDGDGPMAKKIRGDFVDLTNIFALLPEDCLISISKHAAPIDTYNLCCTCRFYHHPRRNRVVKQSAVVNQSRATTLAKLLMNSSLRQGLDNALARNQVGFDVAALQRLHDMCRLNSLPPSSILLSGSIVLQACLGRSFSRGMKRSDADFFCSRDAAKVARAWLVDESCGGAVYIGLKRTPYSTQISSHLEPQSGGDRIDHVEAYGPAPSETFLARTKHCISTIVSDLHSRYASKRAEISQAWRFPLIKDRVPVDGLVSRRQAGAPFFPHLDFTPLPGTSFPFIRRKPRSSSNTSPRLDVPDDSGDSDDSDDTDDDDWIQHCNTATVDLVVARHGWTAQDLVDRFDLDACMCSYDGETFRIKNPSFVFNVNNTGQGRCTHAPMSNITRNADVLHDFFGEDFEEEESTEGRLANLEQQKYVSKLVRYLWDYECHLGIFPDDRVDEEQRFFRVDDVHQLIRRAVSRINKYRLRGINIIDSDHIPSEYSLPRRS